MTRVGKKETWAIYSQLLEKSGIIKCMILKRRLLAFSLRPNFLVAVPFLGTMPCSLNLEPALYSF